MDLIKLRRKEKEKFRCSEKKIYASLGKPR